MADKKTTEKVVKGGDVYNGDTLVRSYNEEDHGKDYKELAKSFAKKKGYKVV